MEFLEAISVCRGWRDQFFAGAAEYCFLVWAADDDGFFSGSYGDCAAQADMGRSGGRLGFHCMHYDVYWWDPVVLHGYYGAVYFENLYGSQEAAALYCGTEQSES